MKLTQKILLLPGILVFSYIVTSLSLLILAFFLYKYNLSETAVTLFITIIYIISCFLGGFFIGKKVDRKKYLWGAFFSFFYLLILVLSSVILSHDVTIANAGSIAVIFLCLGSGTLGGMVA